MARDVEIIARLGHACGCEWAKLSRVCDMDCPWDDAEAVDGHWPDCAYHHRIASLPPTLAEWQAEWAREHPGEPGPVEEWKSEDGRVRWKVIDGVVRLDVRVLALVRWRDGSWVPATTGLGVITGDDVIELGRLMKAADGGAP